MVKREPLRKANQSEEDRSKSSDTKKEVHHLPGNVTVKTETIEVILPFFIYPLLLEKQFPFFFHPQSFFFNIRSNQQKSPATTDSLLKKILLAVWIHI